MRRATTAVALLLFAAIVSGDPARPAGGMESSALYSWPETDVPYSFPVAREDYLVYSSLYGWRVSPLVHVLAHHDGLDIAAVEGAQAVAMADGEVVEPWPPPGVWWLDGRTYRGHDVYGGMVILDHGNGLYSLYGHLSELWVHDGERVKAGQPLGRIGDTGKSMGEHLHFEIRLGHPNGKAQNPLLYIALLPGARKVVVP